jgi:hypothetical protein
LILEDVVDALVEVTSRIVEQELMMNKEIKNVLGDFT